MKPVLVSVTCTLALIAPARPSFAAGRCQDIPLRVTIYNQAMVESTNTFIASAILPDGNGQYIDGVNAAATIKVCSGTNDAVISGGNFRRTFTFVMPAPIEGSIVQAAPGWAPGTVAASGFFNIRSLTFSTQPFATMAGSTFTIPVDSATYRLGFKGQSPTLPNAPNLTLTGDTPGDNTPFYSSPVVVYPNYRVTCGPGSMPTWLVRATSQNYPDTKLEVSTLHKKASNPHGTDVHEGQYSMPFEMFIEALKCFTY